MTKLYSYGLVNVFPVYEAHYESEIKDSLETVNNPFEGNESIFLSKKAEQLNARKEKEGIVTEKAYTDILQNVSELMNMKILKFKQR